jgi:hypothetical protein
LHFPYNSPVLLLCICSNFKTTSRPALSLPLDEYPDLFSFRKINSSHICQFCSSATNNFRITGVLIVALPRWFCRYCDSLWGWTVLGSKPGGGREFPHHYRPTPVVQPTSRKMGTSSISGSKAAGPHIRCGTRISLQNFPIIYIHV